MTVGGPGRLVIRPAAWSRRQFRLSAAGRDVSIGALCPIPLTGKLIAPAAGD